MARTKGSKNGVRGINIDKTEFEKLCGFMCTEEEICSFFNVCEDTLVAWCKKNYKMTFEDTFKVFSRIGKASLRRTQFALAKTNPGMAIFLGKQYLGQKDVVEQQGQSRIMVVNDVPAEDEPDEEEGGLEK